ncbi:MAG: lipid IV(A) 3-deoxy-D-manno-octulosonic acid transferase [Steroidobacteraceae bacterium]
MLERTEYRMRLLYSLLTHLVAPLAFLVQLVRGFGDRAYWDRAGERFGFGLRVPGPTLWVHAVSVGEVRAAAILVPRLMQRWPGLPVVITTTTPTGARQVRELFADRVTHRYLPFDLPGAVCRFLDRVQPRAGIVMETEIWPVLFGECNRRGIPLTIASARLSPRSTPRYRRFRGLLREVFAGDVTVAAQSVVDVERYVSVGANHARTFNAGNVKFDLEVPAEVRAKGRALREQIGAARPVWIAGSTRDGEEALLLDAHSRVLVSHSAALLILVPRHPQRFADVATLLGRRGVRFATRSRQEPVTPGTTVLLVDTLGELLAFYASADVAFVGGTLVAIGGHNLLEPAALGLPVLTGPHVFNAPEVARTLLDAGAAIEVRSEEEVAISVTRLLRDEDERKQRGEAGLMVLAANRGAVERVLQLVAARMPQGS